MPARGMGSRLGWAVYRLFTTRDERQVFIAITSNAHWERFCKEFGLLELWEDAGAQHEREALRQPLTDHPADSGNRRAGQHHGGRWSSGSSGSACRTPPVNSPLDVLADHHLNEGGRLLEVQGADGQTVKVPALPVAGDGLPAGIRHDPPALGQHSAEILAELGYPADEHRRLRSSGASSSMAAQPSS